MELQERLNLLGTIRDWYWQQKEDNEEYQAYFNDGFKALNDCYSACEIAIRFGYEDEEEMLNNLFIVWDNMSWEEYNNYKWMLWIAIGILKWEEEVIQKEKEFMKKYEEVNKGIENAEKKIGELLDKFNE